MPATHLARESDHLTKGEIMRDTTWALSRDSSWGDGDEDETSYDTIWGT